MKTSIRSYKNEDVYWRLRNFLSKVFLLNDWLEQSWHVARLRRDLGGKELCNA